MQNTPALSIGVAFITHNAKHHLQKCLPPLLTSELKPRVLVVNSSSQDGTVDEAKRLGAETLVISRKSFNHGATRELARKHLATDIVVMMTPDAYAADQALLEHLTAPLISKQAAVAYARQIPHLGADFFESFARHFNYPEKSHIRSLKDLEHWGVYTFFCSNSCAAYLNKPLDLVGGFPTLLLGEDTVVVAKLLQAGHSIAYVAEAVVHHSHRYGLKEEFKRSFDTGLAREGYRTLFRGIKDNKRGKDYVSALMKQLLKTKPHLLPYAVLQILSKWAGYRLGQKCLNAPISLKRRFSSQDFYWTPPA